MQIRSLDIVGAGRVGQTLAALFSAAGVEIGQVFCRDLAHAKAAVAQIAAGEPCANWVDFAQKSCADAILIATPDDAIESVCEILVAHLCLKNRVIFHASGAFSSEKLQAARQVGAFCASAHPVRSFAVFSPKIDDFRGTFVALEGDACEALEALFLRLGARPFALRGEKIAYHAACAVASNFAVVLGDWARDLAARAGLPQDLSAEFLGNLAGASLQNALRLGGKDALTGPIARGDVATVRAHWAILSVEERALYAALGRRAWQLAAVKNPEILALFDE